MSDKPPPYSQPGYPPPAYPAQPGYPPPQQGYPPAQPGYPPPQGYGPPPPVGAHGAHTTTTTVTKQQPTNVVVGNAMYGDAPVSMVCPFCTATIVTSVVFTPGTMAWLACAGLIFVGCSFGCCLIPFCVDAMQDAVHICPNCRRQLGVFRRM